MNKLKALYGLATSIPTLMSGGYGILIRLGLIASVAGGLWLWGFLYGHHQEEVKLDKYEAQVDAEGREAVKRNAATKAAQDQNLKEIRNSYADYLSGITDYYKHHPHIVRVQPSGSPTTPAPECQCGDDGSSSESDVAGQDPEFEKACALDAARINLWRSWAVKNHIPVED